MQQFISKLNLSEKQYKYIDLPKISDKAGFDITNLPFSLRVLLENVIRQQVNDQPLNEAKKFKQWLADGEKGEIDYMPARVLMQDFTGVPAVVDLAAMRDAMAERGQDPQKINPQIPVDLIIDHSVQVDKFASPDSYQVNTTMEMKRNKERYEFLKWGRETFDNFSVVPPGTGICHQVNLEYLARVVKEINLDIQGKNESLAIPDTLVGTDSHTTMINGLSILGWGVGGIEAEAAMLGQPIPMLVPEVVGVELTGALREGATATDLVLNIAEMLRAEGVVGKFVEFFGEGLDNLPLADRATISNMSPEFGATCAFFPIDDETLKYMRLTGHSQQQLELVENYAKSQRLWRDEDQKNIVYSNKLKLDLSEIKSSLAGPKRPQDKVLMSDLKDNFRSQLPNLAPEGNVKEPVEVEGEDYKIQNGSVAIAAITSCTNTSNPEVMVAAGLVARKAKEKGIYSKPWVKTSLAPGSKVVTQYLEDNGLDQDLNSLGFELVGYGCTTCIGNSGPLPEHIAKAIDDNKLVTASVLSGNRNFEGRVHPQTRANYLASPPLVVAYAISGSVDINLESDPIAKDENGYDVYLADLWPSKQEIRDCIENVITPEMFKEKYKDVYEGEENWKSLHIEKTATYNWDPDSTYINNPPFFTESEKSSDDIKQARVLAMLGDSVTTDHISPAGAIAKNSPAGKYLEEKGVKPYEFNSYGSRRGNHEVMMRGTFANVRIRNEMCPEIEGGYTKLMPDKQPMSIYDAAMEYKQNNTPLVIIAGKEYGTGSSRDWAAKGTKLLGVKATIAESYERIHRSNLVGMGVLPLQFTGGWNRKNLGLTGEEIINIEAIEPLDINKVVTARISYGNGSEKTINLQACVYTGNEVEYLNNSGILQTVLNQLSEEA